MQRVENALIIKDVVLPVFFDIEEVFDKVRADMIETILLVRETSTIVYWIVLSLLKKTVTATLGDRRLLPGQLFSAFVEYNNGWFTVQGYAKDGLVMLPVGS